MGCQKKIDNIRDYPGLVELYINGMSLSKLEEKFGIIRRRIRRILVSQGVEVRSLREAQKLADHSKGNKFSSGPQNPAWKGDARQNERGYVRIYQPHHPRSHGSCVFEHILVMEAKLGRLLKENEVVHHENEIKNDNSIENLRLMTALEHLALHRNKRLARIKASSEQRHPVDAQC